MSYRSSFHLECSCSQEPSKHSSCLVQLKIIRPQTAPRTWSFCPSLPSNVHFLPSLLLFVPWRISGKCKLKKEIGNKCNFIQKAVSITPKKKKKITLKNLLFEMISSITSFLVLCLCSKNAILWISSTRHLTSAKHKWTRMHPQAHACLHSHTHTASLRIWGILLNRQNIPIMSLPIESMLLAVNMQVTSKKSHYFLTLKENTFNKWHNPLQEYDFGSETIIFRSGNMYKLND